jgi:hypothetical protein
MRFLKLTALTLVLLSLTSCTACSPGGGEQLAGQSAQTALSFYRVEISKNGRTLPPEKYLLALKISAPAGNSDLFIKEPTFLLEKEKTVSKADIYYSGKVYAFPSPLIGSGGVLQLDLTEKNLASEKVSQKILTVYLKGFEDWLKEQDRVVDVYKNQQGKYFLFAPKVTAFGSGQFILTAQNFPNKILFVFSSSVGKTLYTPADLTAQKDLNLLELTLDFKDLKNKFSGGELIQEKEEAYGGEVELKPEADKKLAHFFLTGWSEGSYQLALQKEKKYLTPWIKVSGAPTGAVGEITIAADLKQADAFVRDSAGNYFLLKAVDLSSSKIELIFAKAAKTAKPSAIGTKLLKLSFSGFTEGTYEFGLWQGEKSIVEKFPAVKLGASVAVYTFEIPENLKSVDARLKDAQGNILTAALDLSGEQAGLKRENFSKK